MKDKKLNQLFAAARRENPPAVPAGYAVSAAAMIMLCAALELGQTYTSDTSIDDDLNQICTDWGCTDLSQ